MRMSSNDFFAVCCYLLLDPRLLLFLPPSFFILPVEKSRKRLVRLVWGFARDGIEIGVNKTSPSPTSFVLVTAAVFREFPTFPTKLTYISNTEEGGNAGNAGSKFGPPLLPPSSGLISIRHKIPEKCFPETKRTKVGILLLCHLRHYCVRWLFLASSSLQFPPRDRPIFLPPILLSSLRGIFSSLFEEGQSQSSRFALCVISPPRNFFGAWHFWFPLKRSSCVSYMGKCRNAAVFFLFPPLDRIRLLGVKVAHSRVKSAFYCTLQYTVLPRCLSVEGKKEEKWIDRCQKVSKSQSHTPGKGRGRRREKKLLFRPLLPSFPTWCKFSPAVEKEAGQVPSYFPKFSNKRWWVLRTSLVVILSVAPKKSQRTACLLPSPVTRLDPLPKQGRGNRKGVTGRNAPRASEAYFPHTLRTKREIRVGFSLSPSTQLGDFYAR